MLSKLKQKLNEIITRRCLRSHHSGDKVSLRSLVSTQSSARPEVSPVTGYRGRDEGSADHPRITGVAAAGAAVADRDLHRRVQACHHRPWHF